MSIRDAKFNFEAAAAVLNSPTGGLAEYAIAGGLDRSRDFRGLDMRGWDLAGQDLRGFDLSRCDLRGTDIAHALVDDTTVLTAAKLDTDNAPGSRYDANLYESALSQIESNLSSLYDKREFDQLNRLASMLLPFTTAMPLDLRTIGVNACVAAGIWRKGECSQALALLNTLMAVMQEKYSSDSRLLRFVRGEKLHLLTVTGNIAEAIEVARENLALSLHQSAFDDCDILVDHLNLAQALMSDGRFDDALSEVMAGLARRPSKSDEWLEHVFKAKLMQADCLIAIGEPRRALDILANLKRPKAVRPNTEGALRVFLVKGKALADLGETVRAKHLLRNFIAKYSKAMWPGHFRVKQAEAKIEALKARDTKKRPSRL